MARWDRDGRLVVCFNKKLWDCDDLLSCDMNQVLIQYMLFVSVTLCDYVEVMRDRAQRNYGLLSGAAGLTQMRDVLTNDINTYNANCAQCTTTTG